MKTAKPAPEAAHAELIEELQSIIAAHLLQLLAESEAMSAHLVELGEVRRDVTLKARLGSTPGAPITRANIALSAHAVGDLGEEKARTSAEHIIRAPKQATQPEEDPGQGRTSCRPEATGTSANCHLPHP